MNFPVITIDYSYFQNLGDLPPWAVMGKLFLSGGWLPFLIVLMAGFWKLWVQWRQNLYAPTIKYVLLAVDIPKESEQTPKAMENMFAHLAGTYSKFDRFEKYWLGKIPTILSFEIISIEGYIQFLIRTPVKHRDLVEATIYAQYTDAEITEVEDYVDSVPKRFPDSEWNMWGTEFVLGKKSHYPIKTYINFEQSADKLYFKDPMASLLESISKIKPGEQLWLQLILVPIDDSWKDAGEKEAKKLAGHTIVPKKSPFAGLIDAPVSIVKGVVGEILPTGGGSEKKQELFPRAMMLTTGERDVIGAIQTKASKIGFAFKYRVVYLAKKDVYRKGSIISLIKGAMQQYSALNLNGFKSFGKVTPKTDYFYQRWHTASKQNNLLTAYRYRNPARGGPMGVLNTEELATIFHFPSMHVKAPLLKKTETKRAEPPIDIPLRGVLSEADASPENGGQGETGPENLPIV